MLGELSHRASVQEQTEESITEALSRAERRLQANENAEMELVSLRIRGDLADDIFQRQKALLKAERAWLREETVRLQRQVEQVQQDFVTVEQVNTLRERVADKLDGADFDTKRMVLEALETRVLVAPDGALKVSFSIPASAVQSDIDGSIVSVAPGDECCRRWSRRLGGLCTTPPVEQRRAGPRAHTSRQGGFDSARAPYATRAHPHGRRALHVR